MVSLGDSGPARTEVVATQPFRLISTTGVSPLDHGEKFVAGRMDTRKHRRMDGRMEGQTNRKLIYKVGLLTPIDVTPFIIKPVD